MIKPCIACLNRNALLLRYNNFPGKTMKFAKAAFMLPLTPTYGLSSQEAATGGSRYFNSGGFEGQGYCGNRGYCGGFQRRGYGRHGYNARNAGVGACCDEGTGRGFQRRNRGGHGNCKFEANNGSSIETESDMPYGNQGSGRGMRGRGRGQGRNGSGQWQGGKGNRYGGGRQMMVQGRFGNGGGNDLMMGQGRCRNGDSTLSGRNVEARRTIHNLFDNRGEIQRDVTHTATGVKTHTWSGNPEVSDSIKEHVAQMLELVESDYGMIRGWDPLFRSVFEHKDDIETVAINDETGVHITSEGNTPCAERLVQMHADVVSGFVSKGREEARQPHSVPDGC